MAVSLKCEAAGCLEVKRADDLSTCVSLMNLHQKNVHEAVGTRQKAPKICRPTLQQDIEEEDWVSFTRRWSMFLRGTEISSDQVTAQLLACCEPDIEAALVREDPDIAYRSAEEILAAMKRLTVVSVALSARRTKLLRSTQAAGEHVRQYVARLRGLANVCEWTKVGSCSQPRCSGTTHVNYTEDIVKMVLLNSLSDEEIKKEVLGTTAVDSLSLAEIVALIDSKEIAARAMTTDSSKIAVSSYKKSTRKSASRHLKDQEEPSDDDKLKIKMRCTCGKLTQRYGNVRGKLREFQTCLDCWKNQHSRNRAHHVEALFHHAAASELNGNNTHRVTTVHRERFSGKGHESSHMASHNGQKEEFMPHPTLTVSVSVDREAYRRAEFRIPPPRQAELIAVADSGAQTCLMGISQLRKLGLQQRHVHRVQKRILAANEEAIHIIGVVFLKLSGADSSGRLHEVRVTVHVTDATQHFYLSRAALTSLGVIEHDFPKIGAKSDASASQKVTSSRVESGVAPCGCPKRSAPPPRPAHLPMAPSLRSADAMKDWLLAIFASSTFNTCPHQPLPAMTGPPMEIQVDPDARPVVTKRPPNVPVHWRKEVSEQLERDVALGVIERVPANTPVTWLHSMVLTPKSDGSPRRTVDLQPLNRHSQRDTHYTVPPVRQARSVPTMSIKTVTDAWNGFHSIEIRPEDRHLTTFLTEQGRFRYKRAPMGFLASQDAYTQRYDAIIADVPRKTKCVDDTLIWDSNITDHWWRVIDYLIHVGHNGVILNPAKFQFSSTTVNFAGFKITSHEVRPLPKYLDAIASFPRPVNITDVRAWFGLVNQVSQYGRTTNIMAPFKPLLSPKVNFYWNPQLEDAFQKSKQSIIDEIRHGVEIFDPNKLTCLNPDWSQTGVGYWLRQKHCSCDSQVPGCCVDGWKITAAGSRFLRDAEKRYAPIEGEALAVAWALEDTKFFSMGCRDLVITTDHKPLVKVLGDRALGDISNPRLFRLKQRTLMWRYKIVHVPGRTIPAADATSRKPSARDGEDDDISVLAVVRVPAEWYAGDDLESGVVAAARSATDSLEAVTWARVRECTASDKDLQMLIKLVERGFPSSRDAVPEDLQPFWQYRDDLSVVDDVLMMNSRIVVPHALRNDILCALHSAHQGTSRMSSRARDIVFWPGLSKDIELTRSRCRTCWAMAPSQSRLPPVLPNVPTRPFQHIAADFADVRGTGYLVVVDRFSGWPHLVISKSGAKGLISTLVSYFSSFGVAEEISTDGGPEFTAQETESFLTRWGVRHRLSSAYHPQSNGRAEVTVKSMKRLLASHTNAQGVMNSEAVAAGLLQYRNTPDPETCMSPSQIVFGRQLRDLLPVTPDTHVFNNSSVHPVWRDAWRRQESALRLRFLRQIDQLNCHVRQLKPLTPGNRVLMQNQTGAHEKRWDRTGVIVEGKPYDQYLVKVDGSGRLSLRNRRFLRHIKGFDAHPSTPTTRSKAAPSMPPPPSSSPPSLPPSPPASHPPAPSSASSPPSPPPAPSTPPSSPPSTPAAHGGTKPLSPHSTSPAKHAHSQQTGSTRHAVIPRNTPETTDIMTDSRYAVENTAHPSRSLTDADPSDASQPPARPRRTRRPPAYLKDYLTDL